MKSLFSAVIFTIVSIYCIGQSKNDTSKHLSFKGVPITGTLNEFIVQMKNAGFNHIGTEDGMALLSGDFATYRSCFIGVSTLKNKDLVHKVGVMFPEHETWSSLSLNYFELKELLNEKYGKPTDSVEKFQSISEPKDDNAKMYEVQFDRCKYVTTYETGKGTIVLSIDHDGVTKCFVKLLYLDKRNTEAVKKQALDDL